MTYFRRASEGWAIDRRGAGALLLLLCVWLGGCAAPAGELQPWPGGPANGKVVATRHYALHTTIADRDLLEAMADTMERAHKTYRALAPLPPSEAPERFEAYIFALRKEWAEFTEQTTGSQATVYLQIGRGGYAHGDSFATFYHGGPQTLAVCRHEGWHQYVAVGFRTRPPPFLEEGLATLFEAGFHENDVSRPRTNLGRLNRLREAVRRKRAWPLEKLLTMHAGHVVGTDGRMIDTFYAQAWALARFLASDDELRSGFRSMLAAYAAGEVVGGPRRMLEVHLGLPFDEISDRYEAYVRRIVATR